MTLTRNTENYLEAILMLSEQKPTVRAVDISAFLGYSKPSVSIALKKLRESGYVCVSADGAVTLPEKGMQVARQMLTRHNTVAKLLLSIGVSPENAFRDACRIEHDISEETFTCIRNHIQNQEVTK